MHLAIAISNSADYLRLKAARGANTMLDYAINLSRSAEMSVRSGKRIYGSWAGNPQGREEDPTRCVESIYRDIGSHGGAQCSRPRGHGPNGEWCKQHDPIAVKAKKDVRHARWKAESDAKQARWEKAQKREKFLEACEAAIKRISAGYNDARGLAEETLRMIEP